MFAKLRASPAACEVRRDGIAAREKLLISSRAGSRRLDNAAGRIEGGVYTKIGGVEQDGVGCGLERGDGPALVALVAPHDIGQHGLIDRGLAAHDRFAPATQGPRLGGRGDIEFDPGVGDDDRADVAAVQHGSRLAGGEGALDRDQSLAHLWVDSHPAGRFAHGGRT